MFCVFSFTSELFAWKHSPLKWPIIC